MSSRPAAADATPIDPGPDSGEQPGAPIEDPVLPVWRGNGLLIMLGCVVLGMVPTSIYFHWKVPGVIEEFRELVANAPKTPAGRLELWFELNQPQIHNRLKQFRLSQTQPWLVTHALAPEGVDPMNLDAAMDAFGIDFTELPVEVVKLDHLEVAIELVAPTPQGRVRLSGLNAPLVPRYPHDAQLPAASELAIELIEGAMRRPDDFLEAFARDNPGATFVIRVGAAERLVASSPLPATEPGPEGSSGVESGE